jgi:hypothetical protein
MYSASAHTTVRANGSSSNASCGGGSACGSGVSGNEGGSVLSMRQLLSEDPREPVQTLAANGAGMEVVLSESGDAVSSADATDVDPA